MTLLLIWIVFAGPCLGACLAPFIDKLDREERGNTQKRGQRLSEYTMPLYVRGESNV